MNSKKKSFLKSGFWGIIPLVIGTTIFKVYPLISILFTSFKENYRFLTGKYEGIGLNNYYLTLSDEYFTQSIVNTFLYSFFVVIIGIVLSIIVATLLSRAKHCVALFQFAIFLPFITCDVSTGMVWRYMFNDDGVFNSILNFFHIESIGWLTDANFSLLSLSLYGIWSILPKTILILYCFLLNFDEKLIIAAKMDGASKLTIFFHIVLPVMFPIIAVVFLLNSITALLEINALFTLFQGNPGPYYNLYTVVYYIYTMAQEGRFSFGIACAATILLLVIVMFFLILRVLIKTRRHNRYE